MTEVLKAETPVYGGYVISRAGGVVFIKGAIAGETVLVETIEKRKDYSIARAVEILEPSGFREEPRCGYYGACGGCQLQHLSYPEQVSMKAGILKETLNRIAGAFGAGDNGPACLPPLSGPQFAYRHRAQFKAANGKVGFFREASTELVEIDRCPVMADRINEKLAALKTLPLKGVREVQIMQDERGEESIALLKGIAFDGTVAEEFLRSGSFSGVAFEDGSYSGRGHLSFGDLPGVGRYTVSPWSFFQSNRALNRLAVAEVLGLLSPLDGKKILDVYAGGGNFSLPMAGPASRILALEGNRHSARDGVRNVEANGIKNVKFIVKPVEKALQGLAAGSFDSVILDPPRPGLTREAMARLLALRPEKIVYISCNPATLARDLKKLSASYRLDSIRPADFFPNTYHIESISVLTRI